MKIKIMTTGKTEKGSRDLPSQFNEPVRTDLIQRAVLAVQAAKRQPYGTDPRAGMKYSSDVSRRRRDYRGSYGKGISRVPRKVLSRSGANFNWVGATMPGTVGGRVAHPPKAEKIWTQKVNKKENRKAIRSAIAATIVKELVEARGHKVPKEFPFVIEDKFETMKKTIDVKKALEKLGFEDELQRASKRKIRSGKGKARGRRYQNKVGPLLVVSKECSLSKIQNIPGVDVVEVKNLNAEMLAPGCQAGRLTLWTESALETLGKENLFTNEIKKVEEKTTKKAK